MTAYAGRIAAALVRIGEPVVLGGQPVLVSVFAMPPGAAKTYVNAGDADLAQKPILGIWAPATCEVLVDDVTTIHGREVMVRYVMSFRAGGDAAVKLALLW